ncbi:hypothetical protein MBLNU230_g5178t2 [Neophaeotheca triangularis]
MAEEYYAQRSCVPGTLMVTEATAISRRHVGKFNCPGIWSEDQIKAWKGITDAVHANGCRIWCQLWAMGRTALPDVAASVGSKVMSSSAVPVPEEGIETPVEMTDQDIQETISDYVSAAKNAMEAGFDGVEIHGANGYLPDQFLQNTCNKRTDRWGGSIENRCRFHFEVAKAIAEAVGAERTAMRLSPWSDWQGMLMKDPIPDFTRLVELLKTLKLGYLHLVEARLRGNDDVDVAADKNISWLVKLWDNTSPVLIAGGFKPDTALEAADKTYRGYDVAIVFGRYFVSNPDLVFRLKASVEMKKYDRSVFYTPKLPEGYIDYPLSAEFVAETRVEA